MKKNTITKGKRLSMCSISDATPAASRKNELCTLSTYTYKTLKLLCLIRKFKIIHQYELNARFRSTPLVQF